MKAMSVFSALSLSVFVSLVAGCSGSDGQTLTGSSATPSNTDRT